VNYKELSNTEKLEALREYDFTRKQISYAEEYMLALIDDNRAVIEEYEAFGDSPRHIIENKAKHVRAVTAYGFTDLRLNKHGWLEDGSFMDCEEICFNTKERVLGNNSITLGRSPNHRWTYGLYLAASISGHCSGLSVFKPPYNSRKACLIAALEYFTDWHQRQNDKKTAPILKQAMDMLNILTGKKVVQMSLFTM
jgi:hypothetical protein